MTENQIPRIYLACLSAYCNGRLHGAWIDCNQDADDIWKEIKKMLSNSPEADAEEWAIHCYENWQGIEIGEHEDIERIAELAEILIEHGPAFGAYCKYYGDDDASPEEFTEHYMGEYKSEEDFAYEHWKELGRIKQLQDLGIFDSYIDWEAVAHDLFIDSYLSVEVGFEQVYVFNRH